MTGGIALLILLPLGGAALALSAKLPALARRPRTARAAAILAVAVLVPGAVGLAAVYPAVRDGAVLTYTLGGWPIPVGIGLELDGLAWLSSTLIYVISLLIALYALAHRDYGPQFYPFYLLLIAGMEGVVLTTDVFNMFVSFEIVAIAAYVLIAYHREATALVAAYKYLILSTVGIFFFLFGTFVIYRELGTLALGDITAGYTAAVEAGDVVQVRTLRLALTSLVVGVGVRTAFIPFHTWLPEAHAYAPHPISAVLSGVLIKISFFALIRLVRAFDPLLFSTLLLWIGAVTAVVAVVWALSQRDVKKLLAYHSISQMGYVLAAFGTAGALALPAALYHAVNHGLFKSLLFLAVGTAVHITGKRDVYRMPPLGRSAPLLGLLFAVGALSIAGVPGFNGYASKAAVTEALDGSPAYPLLWLTSVGTAASFIKLSRIFRRGEDGAPETTGAVRLPASAVVGMGVLAVLCVTTGVVPQVIVPTLGTLLNPPGMAAEIAPVFEPGKLGGTAVALALGFLVYLFVKSSAGARLTHRVEAVAPHLRAVLLFFYAGVAGFAAVALFA
ncbi:MAG: complex I subunit 5 family protein [Spirochaetaceae bacterium]